MTPRQWATEIVKKLQGHGHTALFAGGCVRDSMLDIAPKDYDVATSASPDEVQQIFGRKKTLAIGKSFGVITVIGSKSAGNVEVATFRKDGGYSDGRRPDSVQFTDAKEDALRRDFTINGMFFDPVSESVIDYVGGKADVEKKLVRAIGDADQRIEEDKLRMLRGVRFAATYNFDLEQSTLAAIQNRASEIHAVSPERIGTELRRMLGQSGKAEAFELLLESGLWSEVLPKENSIGANWVEKISVLSSLNADFATSTAAILEGTELSGSRLQESWKLTNEEVSKTDWILANLETLSRASELAWSALQPLLISPFADSALRLLQAKVSAVECEDSVQASISRCLEKLSLEPSLLDPQPLVRGEDLRELGLTPGPSFKSILAKVRQLQLDDELNTREEARLWIQNQADQE